jgi:phosphatidylinositol-3-phosphatase
MFKLVVLTAVALVAATSARAAEVNTVFVIALENHSFIQPSSYTKTKQLFGNPAAPFINSLITPGNPNSAMVSYATNYTNVPPQRAGSPSGAGPVHPSEPNYVWAEAGLAGPRNNADPSPANIVNAPSLSAILQANGISWTSYQEGTGLATVGGRLTNIVLPTNQRTVPLTSFSGTSSTYTNQYNGSHQYNYAAKHNPQIFFTATNGGNDNTPSNPQAQHFVPLEQLEADLANNTVAKYNWITPDQYNDMHSTLTGGFTYHGVHHSGDRANIAQGDNFLSIVVSMIEASQAFQNNGAIFIWTDETEEDGAGFTSPLIVISPLAKGNAYTNNINYTHSSDLRTYQELFGVSPENGTPWLGDATNATDLSDLFVAGGVTKKNRPSPRLVSWSDLAKLV